MVGSRKFLATVFTVIFILLSATVRPSTPRELRPADHGLEYQSLPPSEVDPSPDMMTFFGTSASASPGPPLPSSSNAPATDTALTGPMESTGSWRPHHNSGGAGGGGGGGRRDRVRDVLVVASIVCGAAGVVLLGASAFLFLFRFKRERARPEEAQSTSQQEK